MAARPGQAPNMEVFDAYFRRADLDMDGRISGVEAVAFFQGSNLPKHILAQIWMYSDRNKTGFLDRPQFHNALRLITVAQSGRELTPEIVMAALEGPTASKIPAPQINPVSAPTPVSPMTTSRPQLNSMMAPSSQVGTMTSTLFQNPGFREPQGIPNAGVNQQMFPSSNNQFMRPLQPTPTVSSRPPPGANQVLPGGGMMAGPRLPNSNIPNLSTDWLSGRMSGASVGGGLQVPDRAITPSISQSGFGLAQASLATSVAPRPQAPSVEALSAPLSSLQSVTKDSRALVVSGNGSSSDSFFGGDIFSATQSKQDASTFTFPNSSMPSSTGTGPQISVTSVQNNQLHGRSTMPPGGVQLQQAQSLVKQSQAELIQSTPTSIGVTVSASGQPERAWPKMTHSDIQKYSKVFVEVDKDRDGKITGEQARALFLSWKLPREVLKKVWDLSDQDNDSMLSLREFITSLYLMERYREGFPLPSMLPNSVKFDDILLQATGQPSASYGGPTWQPSPGFLQQGMPGPRPTTSVVGLKSQPQAQFSPQNDAPVQPVQQKSSVPVLEKHLVSQLSKEEQNALNLKFQEATDADKKVQELEKEILDSKEKIEFYRTKMQELVLYKSRCDNRLNEITEKASADRREVESLQKKYEEKYKQVGDVASKLTVEEATFRDIQGRKLELYNAIVKMEQGGSADGLLQVRADRIQSDLEELVKGLNERCKRYGLRVKPTALIELPFGWQPGLQEVAADWDEDWDKFEDEGFVIVKELTVDVENTVAPPKSKSSSVWSQKASADEVSLASSLDVEKKTEKPSSNGERVADGESVDAQSEDGSVRSSPRSPSAKSALESPSQDFRPTQFGVHDVSPRTKESQSDHGGSGDKFNDETSWGATFDTHDDADSIWNFNPIKIKESDHERNKRSSFFGSEDFDLNSVRTDSPSAASVFGKKEKSTFFEDSVPGTPLFNSSFSPRYSEGPDDHSFDSFGRFDSFSTHDGGIFPQRDNLARFDSIRSTKDSDHNRGFTSFDDTDPFGSTGPFKSSESHTPRRGSDNWSAF